jgi:hypothetical protein
MLAESGAKIAASFLKHSAQKKACGFMIAGFLHVQPLALRKLA